ncbi:MAG: hypothetical protein V1818_02120 [Candidatus Aenigmatarchaeota archaeon]
MKKVYILGIVLMSVALLATMMPGVQIASQNQGLEYNSMVCIYKNGEMIECSENALTDAGKNAIKDLLGSGTAGAAFNYIALGNGSTPGAGSTNLAQEIGEASLGRALGTFNSVGTGNWSITKTFTASGAVGFINTTALFNATFPTNNTMFAYNTFTNVSLQNADQINVTWTIWVT